MPEELWRAHSLDVTKDSDGTITTSGSFSYWEDEPVSRHAIGDDFQPVGPQGPTLKVTRYSISDSVIGTRMGRPFRQWQITVEGDGTASDGGNTNIKYTFDISKDDNGLIHKTGTMEATNDGDAPSVTLNLGDTFTVPGVGDVRCTKISGGDEYTDKNVHRWTVTCEGASVAPESGDSLVPTEVTEDVSYEINGVTARAVDGEFIVLRRSEEPVTKRSITRYTATAARIANPGDEYRIPGGGSLGLVTGEKVTKETIKENGVEIGSYYRHDIEVES